MTERRLVRWATASDLQAAAWDRFGPRDPPGAVLPAWPGEDAEAKIDRMVDAWSRHIPDWDHHLRETERTLHSLWDRGIKTVPITSTWYPAQLRSIHLPPLVLHVAGDVQRLRNGVAIVGSRKPSPAGEEAARTMAERLAQEGVPVITGMALGTDRAAAQATLHVGGTLIGVLPGGPLDILPKASRQEFHGARATGCLISEVTGRLPVSRASFLRRNRVTSGLARVVVVPSTREMGGTINQIEWAQQQGRPALILDAGAPAGFRVKVPASRLAYHWVGEPQLYDKTVNLWTVPRVTSQAVLG